MVRDWWIYTDDSQSEREPFDGPYVSDIEALSAAVNQHRLRHFTVGWTWRGDDEPPGAGL